MEEHFNIHKIEKFINTGLENEISDISKIIKCMIGIKDNIEHVTEKRSKPYNILDKIYLNGLSENNLEKIRKYHDENFDLIDDALSCLEALEASIRKDLYDYYWEVYWNILEELEISCKNSNKIKEESNKIYKLMAKNIIKQLYEGKKTDIPSNKILTYVEAITAYVFYKCKFLIQIEAVN
ncbi:hypothetical protein NMF83_14865 [Clostridioides difficile]|uniref:hypothetical protein n=1 Tax=Clostridioides difficile TaxID=1496 RepID=UPI0007BBEB70|nr:hypothetical protein [Clostridioides difficile]EGT4907921.1 hypothetical protein [Clostridioides difficile]EGT5013922.1 hypothetical protein [Clostridioides difficile]MBF9986779.1 hypothetical protein [Clostridioides difficile]MBH7479684.1 hypothetical protein [Clostridioides difficile]MCI2276338.1 hypothetical protein [Clostridioides difficile]